MTKQALVTTAGQSLVNEALPEEFRDYKRELDGPALGKLMATLANERPDDYRHVSKKILDAAKLAVTLTGGYSFDLGDLTKSPAGHAADAQARQIVFDAATAGSKHDTSEALFGRIGNGAKKRREQIVTNLGKLIPTQTDAIYKDAVTSGNPFAMQIKSGSRGKKKTPLLV